VWLNESLNQQITLIYGVGFTIERKTRIDLSDDVIRTVIEVVHSRVDSLGARIRCFLASARQRESCCDCVEDDRGRIGNGSPREGFKSRKSPKRETSSKKYWNGFYFFTFFTSAGIIGDLHPTRSRGFTCGLYPPKLKVLGLYSPTKSMLLLAFI
jgi:hypothetical protein